MPCPAQEPCLGGETQLNTTSFSSLTAFGGDTVCCNATCNTNPLATCNVGGTGNSCTSFPATTPAANCLSADGRTIVASGTRTGLHSDHGTVFYSALHCPGGAACCTNKSVTAVIKFDALEDSPIPDCGGFGDSNCVLVNPTTPCRYAGVIFFGVTDGSRIALAAVGASRKKRKTIIPLR